MSPARWPRCAAASTPPRGGGRRSVPSSQAPTTPRSTMRRASRLNEMRFQIVLQREDEKVRALVDKAYRTLEDVGGTASRGVAIPRVCITEADPYYDKAMGFISASLNRKGQVDV